MMCLSLLPTAAFAAEEKHYSGEGDGISWSFDRPSGLLTISGTGDMDKIWHGNAPWRPEKWHDEIVTVVIQDGITGIADDAFSGCTALTSVTIPGSVTKIGQDAFWGCTGLTGVTVPASVEQIAPSTFMNCTNLSNVTIENGVTGIGKNAFAGCPALTSVTIPASVTSIDASAFRSELKTIYGVPGSYAETYAKQNGYAFKNVKDAPIAGPAGKFTDLSPTGFYLDAVAWAVEKNITKGTTDTTFSPKDNCTHGQILTFLWRAAGEPASNAATPFAMNGNEYYYGAAKWAYEKGMIGADFSHKTFCTRADAVSYIWQAAGKGAASYDGRFTDVPANSPYATAVAWAIENGVTTDATATTFNPSGICNRGEIVTFLYRAYSK